MIYIERWGGQITEVREKSLSSAQDAVARLKLMLTRWHIPGGYSFNLVASEGRGEYASHQVIFPDFKASAQPETTPPECRVGHDRLLKWDSGAYSFTEKGITFTVPEVGWWKCSDGHPGKIDIADFHRYIHVGDQFKQHLEEEYGQFTVRHGRIMPKVG